MRLGCDEDDDEEGQGEVLTLLRKPFSTLAALTDRDLGMRMGFSRITVGGITRLTSEQPTGLTYLLPQTLCFL